MTFAMSNLPQEIVDHIVALCQDDTESLISCSSVSTSWTRTSQRYLFRNLTLGSTEIVRFRHFKPTFDEDSVSVPPPKLKEFDDLLGNSPQIATHFIQTLTLWYASSVLPPTEVHTMCKILSRLEVGRLHTIELSVTWEAQPQEFKDAILKLIRRPSVSTVFLGSCTFFDYADLAPLLIPSPSLRHLSVLYCLVCNRGDKSRERGTAVFARYLENRTESDASFKVEIESLRMDMHTWSHLAFFFSPTLPIVLTSLKRLYLRMSDPSHCELVEKLVLGCGRSLKHLEISDMYRMKEDPGPPFLHLDLMPNLHFLRFTSFQITPEGVASTLRHILQFFKSVKQFPPALQTLEISLLASHKAFLPLTPNMDQDSPRSSPVWEALESLAVHLSQASLPPFRKFKLIVSLLKADEDFMRCIEQQTLLAISVLTQHNLHSGTIMEGNLGRYPQTVVWWCRESHLHDESRKTDDEALAMVERDEEEAHQAAWLTHFR